MTHSGVGVYITSGSKYIWLMGEMLKNKRFSFFVVVVVVVVVLFFFLCVCLRIKNGSYI